MDQEQLNVLVIDDDADIRQLLADIINRAEHQVVLAASAEEALELLPFWTFQVAFIDQGLPGMEGLVLGEYLRANNPDMTIAMVTGQEDRKLERKSRDLSMVFIAKPFKVTDILDVVDTYLTGAKSRAARRLRCEDIDFEPPLGTYIEEVAASYGMPNVPSRIQDRLVEVIKQRLNNLRTEGRYTERDRVIVLTGLLTAAVLTVDLPKAASGRTLYEEYDEMMRLHSRRTEFDAK